MRHPGEGCDQQVGLPATARERLFTRGVGRATKITWTRPADFRQFQGAPIQFHKIGTDFRKIETDDFRSSSRFHEKLYQKFLWSQ